MDHPTNARRGQKPVIASTTKLPPSAATSAIAQDDHLALPAKMMRPTPTTARIMRSTVPVFCLTQVLSSLTVASPCALCPIRPTCAHFFCKYSFTNSSNSAAMRCPPKVSQLRGAVSLALFGSAGQAGASCLHCPRYLRLPVYSSWRPFSPRSLGRQAHTMKCNRSHKRRYNYSGVL